MPGADLDAPDLRVPLVEPAEPSRKSTQPAEGPRLDLQVSITEDDLLGLNAAWAQISGERARTVWVGRAGALVPIAGGAAVAVLGNTIPGIVLAAIGVVFALGAGPLYELGLRGSVHQQAAGRNPAMLGPRRIVVDVTGVFEGGRFDRLQVAWAGVTALARDREALYVFYGSIQAIIVPERAFRSSADFERGVSVVERYAGQRAAASKRRLTISAGSR